MDKMCEIKEILEDKMYEVVGHGLDDVSAKELGEVMDILKDIEMMRYYHSVVESMKDPHADMPDYLSRMYYSSERDEVTLESVMQDIVDVIGETPKEQKMKAKQDLLAFINKIVV